MPNCISCNCSISELRLELLPHTKTCVNCSTEEVKVGFMDWYHKTAPELVVVSGKENIRRASRINSRSR